MKREQRAAFDEFSKPLEKRMNTNDPLRAPPLSHSEYVKVLRFMQRTNQKKLLLMWRDLTLLVERVDGATNSEQESGYHDYLTVTDLPSAIRICGVGES